MTGRLRQGERAGGGTGEAGGGVVVADGEHRAAAGGGHRAGAGEAVDGFGEAGKVQGADAGGGRVDRAIALTCAVGDLVSIFKCRDFLPVPAGLKHRVE